MWGCGCPSCAEYGYQPAKPARLYLFTVSPVWHPRPIPKVGITNRSVDECYAREDARRTLLIDALWADGRIPQRIEAEVKRRLRSKTWAGDAVLSTRGSSEVFDVDPMKLRKLILSLIDAEKVKPESLIARSLSFADQLLTPLALAA